MGFYITAQVTRGNEDILPSLSNACASQRERSRRPRETADQNNNNNDNWLFCVHPGCQTQAQRSHCTISFNPHKTLLWQASITGPILQRGKPSEARPWMQVMGLPVMWLSPWVTFTTLCHKLHQRWCQGLKKKKNACQNPNISGRQDGRDHLGLCGVQAACFPLYWHFPGLSPHTWPQIHTFQAQHPLSPITFGSKETKKASGDKRSLSVPNVCWDRSRKRSHVKPMSPTSAWHAPLSTLQHLELYLSWSVALEKNVTRSNKTNTLLFTQQLSR